MWRRGLRRGIWRVVGERRGCEVVNEVLQNLSSPYPALAIEIVELRKCVAEMIESITNRRVSIAQPTPLQQLDEEVMTRK